MGLSDVAGVFSRNFIVGFFVPSFFVLIALSQVVSEGFLPSVYLESSNGARVAIIGGASLLTGLVLLGLEYPLLRLFEGYALLGHWYTKPLRQLLMRKQTWQFQKVLAQTTDTSTTPVQRRNALWRMDRMFRSNADLLLPTRFGNAIGAFEGYSTTRWGLNAIGAWPRIEMLLSPEEQQVHADAKGGVAFFVNGSLLAGLGGMALAADELVNKPLAWPQALLYLVPFLISALCYHASIGAAINWGDAVRASIDLHRLELYEKLGVRPPTNFTEERLHIGPALNGALLRGEAIPDSLASAPTGTGSNSQSFMSIQFGEFTARLERGPSHDRK
jgi:hypothetical protein